MTEEQCYFKEVINLVPDDSICFIQAPSLEDSEILHLMEPGKFSYYQQVKLTAFNKKMLLEILATEEIVQYFQSNEIRFNDQLLFQGHDGMGIGIISKNLILPDQFINKYINDELCIVSKEW